MKRTPRWSSSAVVAAVVAVSAHAQINNNPPGGGGPGGGRRGGGAGVEASVVAAAARSPEVNTNQTITFRLRAPNAKTVRVFTDFPKLGDVPVNGSAGFDMTKDENGVWSYTSPKLAPSYYQVRDGRFHVTRSAEHLRSSSFRRLQEHRRSPGQGSRVDDVPRRAAR